MEFIGCHFEGASIYKCRALDTTFRQCNLEHASFSYGEANESDFGESRLGCCSFYGTTIGWSTFWQSDCKSCDFRMSDLEKSIFTDAGLDGADFSDAKVKTAHFHDATTRETDFSNCDLRQAEKLEQSQIDAAIGNSKTLLPAQLRRPEKWGTLAIPKIPPQSDHKLISRMPTRGGEIGIAYVNIVNTPTEDGSSEPGGPA